MASGRVGGTRSKVSGQVGSNIYQVVRNDDGTYTQVVVAKGVRTEETTTPRLQAQRMVTSMVESLMRDIKPIASISMQSGANKSKSLNAFSSFNLRLVAQDCQAHWYDSKDFVYPARTNYGTETEKLGGKFLLSAGTLQFNCFDSLCYQPQAHRIFKNYPSVDGQFYGVRFNMGAAGQTVGQWLRTNRMTRLDLICFADFRDWYEYNETTEESDEFTMWDYIILRVNPDVLDGDPINESTIQNLFLVESKTNPHLYFSKDGKFFAIGVDCNVEREEEYCWYYGAFTISYLEGKKKISSSYFVVPDGTTEPYWRNHAPTNVFGSWMGEPNNHHYPSPF